MKIESPNQASRPYEISEEGERGFTLHIRGRMEASQASSMLKELGPFFRIRHPRSLTVDLKEAEYMDDFGTLVLLEFKKILLGKNGRFRIINANEKINDILSRLIGSLGEMAALTKGPRSGLFLRLGEATIHQVCDLKYIISFAGSVFLALAHVLINPKSLRRDDTVSYMQKTGVDALPIVGLISFLLGLIMAFMSSVQLQQFGANIYVASLVSLSMTRELGPIMTAILVAGRSGSAYAAEIGTMKVSEEVDALYTMGFEPTRFLVIPKIAASLIVVPLLTLFSDLFAIAGGLVVGVSILDLTAGSYISQTLKTLTLFDVFWGVFKSGVFAFLIAWIGCLRGFQVRGGAEAVGQAATSAVVSSIFLVILFDSLFSVLLRYWG